MPLSAKEEAPPLHSPPRGEVPPAPTVAHLRESQTPATWGGAHWGRKAVVLCMAHPRLCFLPGRRATWALGTLGSEKVSQKHPGTAAVTLSSGPLMLPLMQWIWSRQLGTGRMELVSEAGGTSGKASNTTLRGLILRAWSPAALGKVHDNQARPREAAPTSSPLTTAVSPSRTTA